MNYHIVNRGLHIEFRIYSGLERNTGIVGGFRAFWALPFKIVGIANIFCLKTRKIAKIFKISLNNYKSFIFKFSDFSRIFWNLCTFLQNSSHRRNLFRKTELKFIFCGLVGSPNTKISKIFISTWKGNWILQNFEKFHEIAVNFFREIAKFQ